MRDRKRVRVSKIIKAMILSLALVAGTVTSVGNVFATTNNCLWDISVSEGFDMGESNAPFEIKFYNDTGAELEGTVSGTISKENSEAKAGQLIPNGAASVKVQIRDAGKGLKTASVKLAADGENQINNTNKAQLDSGITFDLDGGTPYLKVEIEIGVSSGGQDPEYGWDNDSVYFVWGTEGETGTFFYHKFTGIHRDESKQVDVSTVTDDHDNTKVFDLSKQTRTFVTPDGNIQDKSYEFVWTSGMEAALADSEFAALSTSAKIQYLKEHRMTVDPVGSSPATPNSINTAGDHNFSLSIVNTEEYKPINIRPQRTKYRTEFDNTLIQSGELDISSTTEANPLTFDTFLLEETLEFNSPGIEELETTNVTGNGVTISKVDTVWKVNFQSNFFDEVTLRIKLNDGTVGYVTVVRKNVSIQYFNPAERPQSKDLFAEVVYPSTDSYKNYKVIFTGVASDGTTETIILDTPNNELESMGNLIQGYETGMGMEGVKKAWYKLPVTQGQNNKYTDIYLNVVKDFTPESETYGGTLQGNGLGIHFKALGNGYARVLSNGSLER